MNIDELLASYDPIDQDYEESIYQIRQEFPRLYRRWDESNKHLAAVHGHRLCLSQGAERRRYPMATGFAGRIH